MNFNFGKNSKINVILTCENVSIENETFNFVSENDIFSSKVGETYVSLNNDKSAIVFLGLGKEGKISLEKIRLASFKLAKELTKYKIKDFNVELNAVGNLDLFSVVSAFTEGLLQSTSAFDRHISDKKDKTSLENIFYTVKDEEIAKDAIIEIETIFSGIEITRELVNERAFNMYPEVLAEKAIEYLTPVGVDVKVLGKREIEELKMEAFLAVSQGSDREPKFIIMTYNGDNTSDEKIALVGKGLTYDSGGYSLKPSASMANMHNDMAGSATVIGAMHAIAKANLKKNIVGIVAACENLVSGKAYKTGDIIGSMAGKTIEVLNTDAEGRITLADALWYAATEVKADKIIDLATLTGACIMAFGNLTTAAITNDDKFLDDLIKASDISGEPIWQLPSFEEYNNYFKSDFADLANTNTKGTGAGTITAGLFLENFVNEIPWIHLDIAGTAYNNSASKYFPHGATGVHVKTLFNLVK